MLSARPIWFVSSSASAAPKVNVSPTIGVPVRVDTAPIQRGASRSSARTIAMRDGTSIVAFTEVRSAMIAPIVTIAAPPNGTYPAAASAIGAIDTLSRSGDSVPRPTSDIRK